VPSEALFVQVEYGQQVSIRPSAASGTAGASAPADHRQRENTKLARKLARAVGKAAAKQQTDALLEMGLNV